MARKRMMSPEFFSSGPVNRLPIPAMITFAGLWCYLDDYGRGEDDAALVKAVVWPRRRSQTEAKVAADLDAIADEDLICRYEAGGERLIHSPSWNEHQKISHKTASKLPPCPEHEPDEYGAYLKQSGDGRDRFRRSSGGIPEGFANGSGSFPPLARGREFSSAKASSVQVSSGTSVVEVDNQSSGRNARATEDPVIQKVQQVIYDVTSRAIDALWATWIRDRIAKLAKDDDLGPAYFEKAIRDEPDPVGRFLEHEPPPPWCGECNPYRRLEHPETGDDAGPCPNCHPSLRKENAA